MATATTAMVPEKSAEKSVEMVAETAAETAAEMVQRRRTVAEMAQQWLQSKLQ